MDAGLRRDHTIVDRLRQVGWKERDALKAELLAAAGEWSNRDAVLEHLETAKKSLGLEVRWEVDEVIEALTPEPEPEPEEEVEEEAPADPNAPLKASDLDLVFDDPRGLLLHKSKVGNRWFATQPNPHTGQPQTFELHAQEVDQLKRQLAGSPYWVLGAGAAGG